MTASPGAGIRDHVVQAVELKFNCFFLMPVVDAFPTRLREELEQAYEEDLDEVFDVAAVRCALESRLRSLESELHQVCTSCPYLSWVRATPLSTLGRCPLHERAYRKVACGP